MPPVMIKEVLIFVINVGTSCHGIPHNSVILEKAKFITKCLIEKKIFLRPKDEVGVILMGSSITKNDLKIMNIQELCNVTVPNWNLIRKILNLEGSNCTSNWVEALYASLEYIRRECVNKSNRILILLSDYKEDSDVMNQFEPDAIANELKSEGVQLIMIGEQEIHEKPENSLTCSEKVLKEVCQQVNGEYLTFDSVTSDVRFYKRVPSRPMGWACNMELMDIHIPIISYVNVTDDWKLPSWKLVTDTKSEITDIKLDNPVGVKPIREYIDKHRVAYDKEDTVTAYMYGSVPVPFTDEDEEAMEYKSGKKCFKIFGFTKRDNIGIKYWCDSSTRVVVPANESAIKPFFNLAQAMVNRNLVAIVRKVYSNNKAPRMVVLFPRIGISDEPWCFVELELPFAEDRRVIDSRPLNSVMKYLSQEQEESVDNLLDSLMLPNSEEDPTCEESEEFLPGCVPNPMIQHTWNMLSYRALNPDDPLQPMEEYLKKLLEPPTAIKERSKCCLEKIKKLFELEKVEISKKKRPEIKLIDPEVIDNPNIEVKIKDGLPKKEVVTSKVSVESMDTADVDLDELAAHI